MENQTLKGHELEESCTPQTISEAIFLDLDSSESSHQKDPSYTVLGQIKTSRHERLRRKKPFVQKVFIDLTGRLSADELQQLCYLDFYQELCASLHPCSKKKGAIKDSTSFSPYFISNTKPSPSRHKTLKQRFCMLAQRRTIRLQPKEPFQLACTLENLWETALRIWEQQQVPPGKPLVEKLVQQAKRLPKCYSLFQEKKNFVHISSLKLSRPTTKRLSSLQQNIVQEFLEDLLAFGYDHFGLSAPKNP